MKKLLLITFLAAALVLTVAPNVGAQVPPTFARGARWSSDTDILNLLLARSIDSPPFSKANFTITLSGGAGYTTPVITWGFRQQNSKVGYWPYVYAFTPSGNHAEILVNEYLNGSVVKYFRLGPGGGNADFMMIDSVVVYKSLAYPLDTLYLGGEFNR